MATTLYFRTTVPDWSRGEGDAPLDTARNGATKNWVPLGLSTTRGAGVTSITTPSLTGAIVGTELTDPSTGEFVEWISDPLNQDVTISGSITANLWGLESSMNANAGFGCIIERLNSQGAIVSTVMNNTEVGIEVGTAAGVVNEALAATSTNMLKGDRLRVRPYFNDAITTTMATGFTLTFRYNGTTAAADGDSYITFTENFGFLTPGADVSSDSGTYTLAASFGAGATILAQSFTPSVSGTLTSITLYPFKTGSPTDNFVVAVQADSAGVPSGSNLSSSASVAGTSLTTSGVLTAFDVGDVSVTASTTYWIVMTRTGSFDSVNYYNAWADNSAPYAGGVAKDYAGGWSGTASYDRRFIVSITVPPGSTLYLTDTASAVDPNGASYDAKEAWTSRGGGVQSGTTSDVAGPTAPLLATVSAGGNFVEWFTKQLTAFTLDGLVACNIRALEVGAASNAAVRCEVALTASDGTSPVVWGAANDGVELGTSEAAMTWNVAGDSTAVTDGQRMRIRVYFDDAPGLAMGASTDMTLYWAGTSAAASGDSYITLPQTVTEFSSGPVANALQTVGGKGMMQAIYPTATG